VTEFRVSRHHDADNRPMLLEHFGLRRPPFEQTADASRLVFPGSRSDFASALLGAIVRGGGFVRIIGDPGTGKSTMCRWLLRKMPPERYPAVHITDPTITPRRIDSALTQVLGMEVTPHDPRQMRARLRDRLNHSVISGERLLLLLDDAHAVPPETLEHLRALGEGIGGAGNALRVVLVGPQELDRRLAHPSMQRLRARIAHDLRLERLGRDDVHEYLHERLRAAGYEGPRIFSAGAIRLIAGLSKGVPARIDALAGQALQTAAADEVYEIHTRDIAAAARAIRLDAGEPRSRLGRLMSLAASGGFAAGAVSAVGAVLVAWRLGWIEPESVQARTAGPATSQRTAAPGGIGTGLPSANWR
jgi:MSHA biogenesis protein MshM